MERKADEREVLGEERGDEMRMSQSTDGAEGGEEGAKKPEIVSGHSCSLAAYIQACHYLSEVTGKDSMIYQTGRQAASAEPLLDGTERCKGEGTCSE
ncbi:hypothetical protein PBY51_019064 [Eleginops maclovinus]|uniref:Uncharacterized protein n=1 Tax=Eleginops maclovinus TaxID=56733 RepID=A0AAN7Y9W0_ELEMC|nr:hypothetical protein PBY51_019064 [Eleginops maclovinus]